ncbi:hypothetical protein ES676_05315 [Bizionia saleffrena]|uniref:Lipoprotein n=1 Tax=Bizionia saleffrena TaxID=291189 RepID=A0A8H2LFZ1_9FLAO|nr:DUF6146 family protein [Bizionia saleffrena]TYB76762.1 hypothetical protein ES676_05315 [Bizionia saleffrena]
MKNISLILLFSVLAFSCKTNEKTTENIKQTTNTAVGDTITISGKNLEYDILIIEPGFNYWLKSTAKPQGFHNQGYLENRNFRYVTEWNQRVSQPLRYNSKLYELPINYQNNIDYGYALNYKLYNYFIYFQNTYKQNLLGGRIPSN